jgi:hypothetical protein
MNNQIRDFRNSPPRGALVVASVGGHARH